jgi:phage terminase small subunit
MCIMKEKTMNKELTPLERRFILELMKDGNRAAAAERAGCKGTKSTFKKLGHQMIVKPHVKKAYDDLQVKMLEKAMLTRDVLIFQIQDTIMEARQAKKFDAAFKGYGQLGELIGAMGKSKKQQDEEQKEAPAASFHQGDEDVDVNDDLDKFLKMMSDKAIKQ